MNGTDKLMMAGVVVMALILICALSLFQIWLEENVKCDIGKPEICADYKVVSKGFIYESFGDEICRSKDWDAYFTYYEKTGLEPKGICYY